MWKGVTGSLGPWGGWGIAGTTTYDFVGHSAAKTAFTLPHWI